MPWEALGPFVDIITYFGASGQRRDDRNKAALAALRTALLETQMYLRDRERGDAQEQDREDKIVHLWGEAGTEFRGIDSDLAMTCHYKAQYWIDPNEWSEERISLRRIGIQRLFERYGELLNVRGVVLEPANRSLIRKLLRWLGFRETVTK